MIRRRAPDKARSRGQAGTATETGMARLDPRVSRLKYRAERLMLTPLFRFGLRVVVPFALCFGAITAWFSVEANRDAFALMVTDVRTAVEERPEFQVRLMAVDGAGPDVAELVRAELSLNLPVSSFDLDIEEMQARVQALDPVRTARLRIRQGGVLQVDVAERVPAVLWRAEDGLRLLDNEGALVRRTRERSAHVDLPVIAGEAAQTEVAEALALWSVSGPIRSRVRGFERMGARRWDVVLDRDLRIMLPEEDAVQALDRVIAMALAPQMDMLSRDISHVDVRLPQRMVLRMTQHATEEMWRIKMIEAGQ